MTWQFEINYQHSVPPFTDSVDATGSYSTGICGQKLVTLDAATPPFLSVTPGANPVTDYFFINYDEAQASELDIGTHTITYTVEITDYAGITTVLTDTFEFTIQCSPSYTEDAYPGGTTTFDLLTDTSATIALPTISGIIASCYTLTFKVYRQWDNQDMEALLPAVFAIGATDMTITHVVSDYAERHSLFGSEVYYFRGTVTVPGSPTSQTSDFTFTINFTDACRGATITSQTLPNMVV